MPTPTSLLSQATARAESDHKRRLGEIKAMAPLLGHLDAYLPALKAQGLEVYVSGLQLRMHHRDGRVTKALRIDTAGILDTTLPARWLHALLGLGFAELQRSDGPVPTALLRKGPLVLHIDLPESAATKARGAQTYANRMAARAAAELAAEVPA